MLPHVHLLVMTDRPGGGCALVPALEFLGHEIKDAPLDIAAIPALSDADVVLVDATSDLREATAACRQIAVHDLRLPIVVIVPETMLAALKSSWGFDDWLLPMAGPAEVETRLRLVKESVNRQDSQRSSTMGDLSVDEDSYQVRLRGHPLDLTFKEFELIKTLAAYPNRVFTRELLLQEVWGYDYFGGSRTVDVHIRRLRAKLGPEHESLIVTVRGVGYKLVPPGSRRDAASRDELVDED